jgi:CRISPR-associated Csx2 family protein
MSKVLVSLIGTGKQASGDSSNNRYITTDYILDGKLYKDKVFTSNVIIEHFKIDRAYFIGTSQSMWDNLVETFDGDDDYLMEILEKKDKNNIKETDLEKLNSLIDKKLGSLNSKCYIIEDGENEEELWGVFDKFLEILGKIEKDDEVYFDVTHLFRSVSLMSFIMAELGKIAFDMKIGGVFYGMLKKNEPSKLINVKMFFEFLEWAKAFEELDKFASLNRLVKLSSNKLPDNAFSVLARMEEAFNVANMSAIYKEIQRLKTHLDYFKENESHIIRILSPRLEEFISKFNKKSLSDFQFALAEFFAQRNNSALGYVALAEAIITKIAEIKGLKEDELSSKEKRDEIKDEIFKEFKTFVYKHPKSKFRQLFIKINNIRNTIAHQLENSKNAKHDIENLPKYIKEVKKYIKEIY